MKKYALALVVFSLVVSSFLSGAWYSRSTIITAVPKPESRVRPAIYSLGSNEGVEGDQVYATTSQPAHAAPIASLPAGTVNVSPEKQQLIGVRVGQVERGSISFTRRLVGKIVADETRLYRLNLAVDSWIQEISSVTVGSLVKKDQPLLSFYSPEFLGPLQAFFYALGALDRYQASGGEAPAQIALTRANIQQAVDTLKNLGMGDIQIEELKQTRQLAQKIVLRAPVTGFVTARNVSPGQKLERGTELFRIVDLSRVWILADLFETDADYFRPGVVAKVALTHQSKRVDARVSDVLPQFDPASRSLKIRLEADNPGYLLRPDMFVDVDLPVRLPPGITVSADAVLDSGLKKTVFVDRGNGFFEPRSVETGWRVGDRVEIVRGLVAGERIVVSGTFLIDSESRMRTASQDQAVPPLSPVHHHAAPVAPTNAAASHEAGHSEHHHD